MRSNKPDVANRASAARVTAGLDNDAETNSETRGGDDASETNDVLNDDADQGVVPDVKDDELPGLTPEHEDVDSDSNDKEESVNDKGFDGASVGDEEATIPSTGQRTRSGRVSRPPNSLIITMTGKSHDNSRDERVNFRLLGKYHPDDDRDNIDCQYADAG